MTRLAGALALLSLGLFAWSYLVYPPLVSWLARRRGSPAPPTSERRPAAVDVILSAADEEEVIGARVENLRRQEGVSHVAYRVVVGCDGCGDRTAERARAAAAEGAGGPVAVVEFAARRGKAAVLNDLLAESRADIVVFTDANTRFEPGAVAALLEALKDPAVGATCGRLVFEAGAGAPETPESVFWDRETRLKEAEGRLGACLGANGGIYAAERALVTPLPPDTTSMDDFLIPARIARLGRRVTFAGRAVAREEAARGVGAEVRRRVRIGIGAGQVLRRDLWLWNAVARPTLTFAFVSRKAARWLAPLFALVAAAAALAVPAWRAAGAAALLAAAAALLLARVRPGLSLARAEAALPEAVGRLYYFVVLNAALALGVALGLLGHSRPFWTRTARS
jgi:cellulose synthase/poly-beta-1,6-N-acetylglucosamine synthase-like glycosyltransferase